ncbi:MAG: hypothetical protein ACNA8K_14955 [Cyclonatronaceae bacterium]
MKTFFLIILLAALFLSSCMSMHSGRGGTHNSHENDHQMDHDYIHLMDDAFHINIQKKTDDPLLMLLTISETGSGTFAQNISGFLTVRDSNISSELMPDLPDQGQYTALIRMPDNNIGHPMILTLENESGSLHSYEFSIENLNNAEEHQNQRNRKILTTTTILTGSAMVLMMAGKWLLFGGF